MSFSYSEIVHSVLYAVLYGGIYFSIFLFSRIAFSKIADLKKLLISLFVYPKITERSRCTEGLIKTSSLMTFFDILIFGLGFILLSYFSLDGCIRIYMAVISCSVFFTLKKFLFFRLHSLFLFIIYCVEYPLIFILRIIILPFIHLIRKKSRIGSNFLCKLMKLNENYDFDAIDKGE